MAGTLLPVNEAGEKAGTQVEKQFASDKYKFNYLLYLPEDYGKVDKQWPVILFLHGAGESDTKGTNDLKKVLKHGPPKICEAKKLQFIVVSPQSPGMGWQVEGLNLLLSDVLAKYKCDPDRVYLTGLSMGGGGTWNLATAHADRFAAIVPICGAGGDPKQAAKLKDLPVWAFHGGKDPTVPLKRSEDMVKAIKDAGGNAKLTVYPDAGHDSWTVTYDNPELYTWLLEHKRSAKSEPVKMTLSLVLPIAAAGIAAPAQFWPIFAAGGGVVLGGLFLLWVIWAPGPRRARGYRRCQRLVRQGQWEQALRIVHQLQGKGRLGKSWQQRLRTAKGECRRTAGVQAVQAKDFEKGLEHHLHASQLLDIDPTAVRSSVVEEMLVELRALFASTTGPDTAAVQAMIQRVLMVQSPLPCPEASFWQGLCHIREGQWAQAQEALQTARGGDTSDDRWGFIDPPLYLGGVLLRLGQPKEGLRYFTEANRIDGNCPLVALQLGIAMVAAGSDGNRATRALDRALGTRGLARWFKEPQKAWVEGLPEHRSFIRKLAAQHRFVCPLWGNDLGLLARQGQLALGQAHFRTEQYQAAAETFQKLFDEGAPTHDVLRWLGLALTRLERYDDAYPHLKTALELEEPKDRMTAGYLAVCAARAKPDCPEDKGPNVAWAVRTVRRFTGLGDREWVGILVQVFGEALALNLALSGEDQVFLCEHLQSVQATDRAELEFAFLKHAAVLAPGAFPTVLGADYPPKGEAMLLERSERLERENQADAALASAEVLLRLAPDSPRALERLAMLSYKHGNRDRAVELLRCWCAVEPDNPVPRARLAVVHYNHGQPEQCNSALRAAIERSSGRARADLACLAGRLLLANGMAAKPAEARDPTAFRATLEEAQAYLRQCLNDDPGHAEGLWLTAAIRTVSGDRPGLAALSPAIVGKECSDSRYHYFAAVSHLAAGRHANVREEASKAAADPALRVEATYLAGWASIQSQDPAGAATAMGTVAQAQDSPSSAHARAIVGGIRFYQGETEEAIQCWQGLDTQRRTAWKVDEPLQKSLFLTGLQALQRGRFAEAAARLREAGKAGFRKIANPDANVVLQMGLLSFQENHFAQAEQEFERAWQLDPTSYAACYNLMLARLCQAKFDACVPLIAELTSLAATAEQRQLLAVLGPLLERCKKTAGDKRPPPLPASPLTPTPHPVGERGRGEGEGFGWGPDLGNGALAHDLVAAMSSANEQRLLSILLSLGQTPAALPPLRGLALARSGSQLAQEAFATAVLLQAKKLAQRCHWEAADDLLVPVAASFTSGNPACRRVSPKVQTATYNLLGCCQCMLQEFDRAVAYFSFAIKLAPGDPWLYQNLALACELQGQIDQADTHWNRYFELQGRVPAPPLANYRDSLAYEGLNRLADVFSKKDRWSIALTYLQRACRIKPSDFETLERLYHMYNQVKRPEDARRTLKRLRELRPNDPQMELYELDLREIKTLEDIERMLADIRKTVNKHSNDLRVEEKAVAIVGNIIPLIQRMFDQYANQLSRVMEQVRRLPNYQINWPTVHEVMGDLQSELQKLRRIANKCLSLVTSEEHRRVIRELMADIDRKTEVCQSMGE